MEYGISKQLSVSFSEAITKVKAALAEEGFGVLTEIDVKATLKKKLNTDWDNYIILGACNPPLAFEALKAEKEIGLMLPCNVIIYEDRRQVFVSAIKPTAAMGMIDNPALLAAAQEVEEKLAKVINNL